MHGGAGGVGTAAIQLARAAGARVTATVRARRCASVAALGAEAIAPEGFAEHGPFDVILELVGAPNLADNLRALATGGRISIIGVSAGAKSELNLLALMGKRARVYGSTLRARPLEEKALARAPRARGAAAVRVGRSARADRRDVPAGGGCRAYERFAAGGKLGKIVLGKGSMRRAIGHTVLDWTHEFGPRGLANEVGVNERTLRRAVSGGLIHARRPSSRRL